jgi:hypothetical protein
MIRFLRGRYISPAFTSKVFPAPPPRPPPPYFVCGRYYAFSSGVNGPIRDADRIVSAGVKCACSVGKTTSLVLSHYLSGLVENVTEEGTRFSAS